MENDKIKKKGFPKAIIVLVILTVIALGAGFAYARYITRLNGSTTADIAQWSFKVNGKTNENFVIDLATTRAGVTQEAEVQEGYIGPGTAGAFELVLDATGSEVSLEYDINMNVDYTDNMVFPKNLIFYTDSTMQNAIYHTDNNINLNGFIGWNDGSKVHTKTIYWKWDYETGSTQAEKDNNDIADSYWMGKPITLSMNVTAKQVNENPTGKYAVTFDANGGTLSSYGNTSQATKQVTYGDIYGNLPVPKRDGYEFLGWNGKNLFNISKRTFQNPGGGYQNNSRRNFTGNGIYVGMTANNYYKPSGVQSYEIDELNNSIKVTSIDSGYGIGFDLKVKPNTSYTISLAQEGAIRVGLYKEDGTWITWNNPQPLALNETIITTDDTYWLLIVVAYRPNQLVENINMQIEEGSTATAYEPYYITSSTEVVQNQNHTLTAIWKPNP